MTTEERMEANANRALWCVHVIGPDDVYAEPSHAAAIASAEKLNLSLWSRDNAPDDVICYAYADVWPWSAERHASDMKRRAEDEATSKPRIPDPENLEIYRLSRRAVDKFCARFDKFRRTLT